MKCNKPLRWFFINGAACLSLCLLGGGVVLFYNRSNYEGENSRVREVKDGNFTGFSYADFLKDGYISLSSDKVRKLLNGISFSRAAVRLKSSSFLLEGKARVGLMKSRLLWLKGFNGKVCGNFSLKAKEVSVSVENSKIKNVAFKDFVIKGNHIFFFSKRKRRINPESFCLKLEEVEEKGFKSLNEKFQR